MNTIIVDDHLLIRIAIRSLLGTNGIAVIIEFDSGDQVVQAVEKTKPELLIVDVDTPGVSDIEMLEQLGKRHCAGTIIIISAKSESFYDKRSAEYGTSGFMNKRESMNNILAAIETVKDGYSYFPSSLEYPAGSSASEQGKLNTLPNQEMKVLRYILNGMDYSTIASKVNTSNKTVSTYKSRLVEKLDCSPLIEIYDYAQGNETGQSNTGTFLYSFDGHLYHQVVYGCKLNSAS